MGVLCEPAGSSARLQKKEEAESRKVGITVGLQRSADLDVFKKREVVHP